MSFAGCWKWVIVPAVILIGAAGRAEVPLVVFDVPLIAECRDVTPRGFREAYQRQIIEAVFKMSPQLVAGDESDLKKLLYEISTEQQMPVVSYLPRSPRMSSTGRSRSRTAAVTARSVFDISFFQPPGMES